MQHRGWKIKHFVTAGIFAAVTFSVAFILGAGIIAATGIPATGGIVNIFAAVFIVIIGVKLVPKFGFATLTIGILFLLSIPTIIGGPPGFHKVINGLLIGLTTDIVLVIGRRSRLAHIIAGSFGAMVSILSIYAVLVIFRLPGVEKLAPLVLPLTILQAVLGALGAFVGILIFERRLSKLNAVKRLMSFPEENE